MSAREPCEVSVVIPSRNRCDLLMPCLRAVALQTHPSFETIVVDDASTDGSAAAVCDHFPHVRLIERRRRTGFAAAANAGAAAATGRFLAFLNSDAEPEPGWLEALQEALEHHPRAAAVEPKTLRFAEERVLDGAGLSMTWSLKAFRRGAGEPDDGRYDTEEEVFAASGTASMWRADVFRRLGGFDESFFTYYEDVDLGFRARRLGYEAWYVPAAVVRHRGAASSGGDPDARLRHSVANRWATVVKNSPARWLWARAPSIVAGEAMWLLGSAARGRLRAHLQAYGRVRRSLPLWLEARRALAREGRILPADLSHLVETRFPPLPRRPRLGTPCTRRPSSLGGT
jgi:GT2 family glycosyltransferase